MSTRKTAARLALVPQVARNRKATPQEATSARTEVLALLRAIALLDLLPAADFIRAMDPPPSAEAIAMLGFQAIELHERARQSSAGRRQRDRDPLTRALREILRAKPAASTDQVIDALRARTKFDVSDDGTVGWDDTDVSKQSIAKRIPRLRPKVRKP